MTMNAIKSTLFVRRRFLGLLLIAGGAIGLRAAASADQEYANGYGARYVADDDDGHHVSFGRRYTDSGRFWLPWISIERERRNGHEYGPVPATPPPAPRSSVHGNDWDEPRFKGDIWDDEPAPEPRVPAPPPAALEPSVAPQSPPAPAPQSDELSARHDAELRVPASRAGEYGPVMVVPQKRREATVPVSIDESGPVAPRPGQFADGPVPLYPRVHARSTHEIAPKHVKAAVAVRDPDICPHPCRCHSPRFVFVEVLVPRWPAHRVEVMDHGTRVALDYGEYLIEVRSRNGVVTVEYDD